MNRRRLGKLSTRTLWEALQPSPPTCERLPAIILLRWCAVCREYMREGSAAAGYCLDCGTARAD